MGNYNFVQVIEAVDGLLERGAIIAFFCQSLSPLEEAARDLKKRGYLNVKIFDNWARDYQVLKNRTHPLMSMFSCSGYLLSAIKMDLVDVWLLLWLNYTKMYAQRCSNSKHYLSNYYQPKPTFLSPANKFGQRSFSTSSLPNTVTPSPLSGSLREQIRLETFKKNLNESKLNKTGMSRVPLKVGKE